MVHGIRLRDGRAEWYRNRWVRSTAVSQALGEDPVPGERFAGMEAANTNVIGHAGRTLAIVEAGGRPAELTDELDTVCFSDLDGTLPHGYTAHPKRDPRTGELHAVSYYWARPEVLEYTVVGTDGRVRHRADVPVPGAPMVHDCSITDRFVALYDLPVTFDLDDAMAGTRFPYRWDDGYGARIGLLPKAGQADEVQWFEVEPCYVFHPLNAHDDGDDVVLDVVRHPRMFDRNRLGPDEGPPTLWRWTIDRAAGKVREEQLDDRAIEFPRVDERLVGRPHRYGWATGLTVSDDAVDFEANAMVRYDGATGATEVVEWGPGRTGGEVVFVPRGADSAEDDGWYLSLVHDRSTDRSELVVLDAAAPAEGPIARVHLPARVPLGFHGNWVPTGQ
jgi:carotenoid cleavage dioxygenase